MQPRILRSALAGRGAHVQPARVFDGLDWRLAGLRPGGSPHSIWQVLGHMIFWQDFSLAHLRGEDPPVPEHAADSWPKEEAPRDEAEWQRAVERFVAGLDEAMRQAKGDLTAEIRARPGRTRAESLQMIAAHNSYHAGQVVLLRRMLGAWPPPGGGDTW